MQISPATQSAAKATRAKSTGATAAAKKPRSKKKTAAEPTAADAVEVVAMYPSPEEITGMIATAAYYIAAERHFETGHELDDWLEAERRVQAQLQT